MSCLVFIIDVLFPTFFLISARFIVFFIFMGFRLFTSCLPFKKFLIEGFLGSKCSMIWIFYVKSGFSGDFWPSRAIVDSE